MKYYRCKDDTGYIVKNELFTMRELRELEKKGILPQTVERLFEELDLKQSEIYWSFGCRFEVGTSPYMD